MSASLSLGLDHVRGGRVHKGTPLSRHHSLTQRYHAERDHPSNGRLRLSSSHHHHQHQRSHPHAAHHRGFLRASSADAGGYGGRGSSGMERGRAGSLGLREGVDGIAVAQVGGGSRGGLRPVPGCCCRGRGRGVSPAPG